MPKWYGKVFEPKLSHDTNALLVFEDKLSHMARFNAKLKTAYAHCNIPGKQEIKNETLS